MNAFGRNQYGKLGTDSSEGKGSNVPTAIKGIAPVTAIAAGNEGGFALLEHGATGPTPLVSLTAGVDRLKCPGR